MLAGRHYQNAYLTGDVDRAIALLGARVEIGDMAAFDAETECWTPDGIQRIASRIAFAWVGGIQIELVQPVSGASDLYGQASDLPADGSMRFHHVCHRVADWDAFRRRVDGQRWPVMIERSTSPDLKFLFLDAKHPLGHFIEFTWMTQDMWLRLGGPAA